MTGPAIPTITAFFEHRPSHAFPGSAERVGEPMFYPEAGRRAQRYTVTLMAPAEAVNATDWRAIFNTNPVTRLECSPRAVRQGAVTFDEVDPRPVSILGHSTSDERDEHQLVSQVESWVITLTAYLPVQQL